MSIAQFTCPLIITIPGQIISASLWNNEWINVSNNLNPEGVGAYSDTDSQMRAASDPFPSGTSRPVALNGEIERIRYILDLVIGKTYWYEHPSTNLEAANTFYGHGHTGGTDGNQILEAGIADHAVAFTKLKTEVYSGNTVSYNGSNLEVRFNSASLAENGSTGALEVKDGSITGTKIGSQAVLTANIGNGQITAAKIATGVIGIKSIQSGSISGNGTATITAVVTAKSFVVMTGWTLSADDASTRLVLTNSTTVTATVIDVTTTYFTVVEFY